MPVIFHHECGIRRQSTKQDALALEPTAKCKGIHDIASRTFYVTVGDRTLGKGISSAKAWKKALSVLERERPDEEQI
jgi:hypothetical protein